MFQIMGTTSRRNFLTGSGAGCLLIGNAFLRGTGLAAEIKKPDSDRYQSLFLRTHEHYGDIEERIDLPKDWKVDVVHSDIHGRPRLTNDELRERICNPVGSLPIREIAAGKKTAVILFDDLTRPTPTYLIAPVVVEELKKGGIKDENILFIAMIGSHWAMTHDQVRAKLGDNIVDTYDWVNHNIFNNLTKLGTTTDGIPIEVNYYFYSADVKVSISGLKKHTFPGYSGGAKAIIPGVSSLNSINTFHANRMGGRFGAIYHNTCRDNMEEYARRAGLDFTVQTIVNDRREPIEVWAGDVRDAFRAGVPEAVRLSATIPVKNADVVITNGYPYNLDETWKWDWANWSLREGGTAVTILQMPLARIPMHYMAESGPSRNLTYWDRKNVSDPLPKAGRLIIYSQYLQHRDLHYPEGRVVLCRAWEQVLDILKKNHGPDTHAAVYPYTGIQHETVELDG